MVTRRAELGQWNTAAPVAQLAIAALGGISPDARVIDPTCGDGAFLAAALAAGARYVVGIEIDPHAAERAGAALRRGPSPSRGNSVQPADNIVANRSVVPRHAISVQPADSSVANRSVVPRHAISVQPADTAHARDRVEGVRPRHAISVQPADTAHARDRHPSTGVEIIVSDVLAPGLVDRLGLFDVAIGNPPYVRAGRVDPAIKRERARVLAADWPELDAGLIDAIARHADFSATCLLRTLRFVRPGGQLALVVSTALLDADGASTLWSAIARVAHIEALIAAPGERWFADAAVNSMLLVARRLDSAMTGDRPPIFSSIARRQETPSRAAIENEATTDRDLREGFEVGLETGRLGSSGLCGASSGSAPVEQLEEPRPRGGSENAPRRPEEPTGYSEEMRAGSRSSEPGVAVSRASGPPRALSLSPRFLRLSIATRELASHARNLDDIARASEPRANPSERRATDERVATDACAPAARRGANDVSTWGAALRAPSVWFAWRDKAREHLVPLKELCEVRRGLTTGANDVFYVRRDEARRLRLEPRFLAPVVRSPFNGAPAPIAIAPDESPLVAIAVPPDANLKRAPRIKAWFDQHEAAALGTSAARRDPWWSLPVHPARLFFAKAYGPRFVQRLADLPMLADQRVYALHPKPGVDLVALAAVLNALPTALALESLGRASMGYGAVEWTVHDALELPVLDVRRADARAIGEMQAALAAIARRPVAHVRLERDDDERARLDRAVLALAPGGEMRVAMWDGLCASVAQRDRYLLPVV